MCIETILGLEEELVLARRELLIRRLTEIGLFALFGAVALIIHLFVPLLVAEAFGINDNFAPVWKSSIGPQESKKFLLNQAAFACLDNAVETTAKYFTSLLCEASWIVASEHEATVSDKPPSWIFDVLEMEPLPWQGGPWWMEDNLDRGVWEISHNGDLPYLKVYIPSFTIEGANAALKEKILKPFWETGVAPEEGHGCMLTFHMGIDTFCSIKDDLMKNGNDSNETCFMNHNRLSVFPDRVNVQHEAEVIATVPKPKETVPLVLRPEPSKKLRRKVRKILPASFVAKEPEEAVDAGVLVDPVVIKVDPQEGSEAVSF